LSVGAGVGQTSELMQSYNNVAQLGHFRGANIGREPAKQLESSIKREQWKTDRIAPRFYPADR
jgi:hypothetical protein